MPIGEQSENPTLPEGNERDRRDAEACKILIDHAIRCWNAERENAERIQGRMKMMATLAAAVFGIGLFRFDWFVDPKHVSRIPSAFWVWTIKILLLGALVFFAYSFYCLQRQMRRRRTMNASWHMFLVNREILNFPQDSHDATIVVVDKIQRASLSLLRRNARFDERLRWANRWFFSGLALVFFAVAFYILFSVPTGLSEIPTGGSPYAPNYKARTDPGE